MKSGEGLPGMEALEEFLTEPLVVLTAPNYDYTFPVMFYVLVVRIIMSTAGGERKNILCPPASLNPS